LLTGSSQTVLRQIRAVFDAGSMGNVPDGLLLERFVRREDESAFESLVERHGPMVLRVCRGRLKDEHDAEDAFQAVFLILARKARSLWVRDSIGPWLHAVALRTAASVRAEASRRRAFETRWAESTLRSVAEPRCDDPSPILLEELGRLAYRYRMPLLLCDLEGLSHEAAAERLGWPLGTVKSRQARGRARLRSRLLRHGLAPSASLLAFLPATKLQASLVASTVKLVCDGTTAGSIALSLANGVIRIMFLKRLLIFGGLTILLGTVGIGVTALAGSWDDPPAKSVAISAKPPGKPLRDVLREAARAVLADKKETSGFYVLTEVARAQARAGDKDGARETARLASEAARELEPVKFWTLLIAIAYARDVAGDRTGALKDLERVSVGADKIDEIVSVALAKRLIAEAQFDLGDTKAAGETVQALADTVLALPRNPNQLPAAEDLARAQVSIGDIDGAFATVDAVFTANGLGNNKRGHVLRAIASMAGVSTRWNFQPEKIRRPEERKAWLATLARVAALSETLEFADDKPYDELAVGWAMLGEFDNALRDARRIGKGPIRFPKTINKASTTNVLCVIGARLGRAGRKEDARATFREAITLIERDPKLTSEWSRIAHCQAGAGEIGDALKTVDAVAPQERPGVLSTIAERQAEAGDRVGSQASLRRAIREVEGLLKQFIEFPADDGHLSELASLQAQAGDFEKAAATLQTIFDPLPKGRAALAIARARTKVGDAEGALAWALTLEPPALRSSAIRGLAQAAASR
jgi:RNA polymerase sigma factor (sigma-70 family)